MLFVGVLVTVGLVAVPAGADAVAPDGVASFLPNAAHEESNQLNDRPEGTTTFPGAHMTAVAASAATQVTWYLCDEGTADPAEAPTGCTNLGTDDSGVQPVSTADEAYELAVSFTAAQAGMRDIVIQACGHAPGADGADTGTVPDNCVQDVESPVEIINGDTGTPSSTTGEMVATCETTSCLAAANYITPAAHGEVFPNTVAAIAMYTTVEATDASICLDIGANASTTEFSCDVYPDNVLFPFETTETYKRGAAFFNTSMPDDTDFAYIQYAATPFGCGTSTFIGDDPTISAGEDTACVLAIQYGASTLEDPAQAVASFETGSATCLDEGVANARIAATPDEDEALGGDEDADVVGCLTAPVSDAYVTDVPATFESFGVAGFDACEGTLSDSDADGVNDTCHATAAGADGVYRVTVANAAGEEGDQSVLFCSDAEGDGCDGEFAFDSVDAHWSSGAPDPECSDGADNDGDGLIDFPNDPGCSSANDDSEADGGGDTPSTISAKYKNKAIKGKVGSDVGACVGGRKVIVKKGTKTVGSDTTANSGAYSVKVGKKKGKYQAIVKPRSVDGGAVQCLQEKSKKVTVN